MPSISQGSTKGQRLIADRRYFGLEARAFRAGAERVLARVDAQGREQDGIDVEALAQDFQLDALSSQSLLGSLLEGGLLTADASGLYRPTSRFREYAQAYFVAPLSRARAKVLLDKACELAARINADASRNPFQIKTVAVSGSYMSRRSTLGELSLWLVLRPRPQRKTRRWKPMLGRGDALREILAAMNALSSFVVVRIVADRRAVPRPFSVAFQVGETPADTTGPAWHSLFHWSASLTRRLASR